ncbi:hypothetical protein BDF20DRAFT_905204 [Mycotypha africana]|uniref:uncharacterized protein n=1 Tax=Mycotypha africana TaxID=64632 RepID=UPI0023008B4A|nr:uncharacterized protein BDF20DRAFT_905204 [Mycotypha africana]KAI8984139.1 hypothetical protein BDF20DRAFT_905204 [Mycotypha africana]
MPQPIKRKRDHSSTEDFKSVRQKIRTLEANLSDKSNLNNIVELFNHVKNDNAQIVFAAMHALNRVFLSFLLKGELQKPKVAEETSAKGKVTLWLRDQYTNFLQYVKSLLSNDEPGLQLPALTILMNNMKAESEYFMSTKGTYHFANNLYGPIVKEIISTENLNDHLRKEFLEKYLNIYDDLRHYFFKDTAEIIEQSLRTDETVRKQKTSMKSKKAKISNTTNSSGKLELIAKNLFSILESIRTMPTEPSEIDEFWTVNPSKYEPQSKKTNSEEDDVLGDEGLLSESEVEEEKEQAKKDGTRKKKMHPLLQLKVHKRSFTDCWLQLFKLPLTEEMYKKILLILHKRILPHLSEPKLLMDFLTDSYNVGGAVSLLALQSLFTLIIDHNL